MREIITKAGFNIDETMDDGFCIDFRYGEERDMFIMLFATVKPEANVAGLHMISPLTLPQEKIPQIEELIRRINQRFIFNHLFIGCDGNRVCMAKVLMLEENEIDKEEFEKTLNILADSGKLFNELIRYQLSSDDDPLTILKRIKYKENPDQCSKNHVVCLGDILFPLGPTYSDLKGDSI